jgi:hypothetical protein
MAQVDRFFSGRNFRGRNFRLLSGAEFRFPNQQMAIPERNLLVPRTDLATKRVPWHNFRAVTDGFSLGTATIRCRPFFEGDLCHSIRHCP